MKIIFAGTPDFAKDHLEIILGSRHEIICVLTQPDRRSGRGKKLQFSPVKKLALEKEITLFQPKTLKDTKAVTSLAELEPDLILVVAYGLIVPPNILEIPKLGCINVHASLLPKWRGLNQALLKKIDIHPLSKVLELREDESTPSLSHKDAMKNSPETKDGHFVVPPSIE